jgi:hypothetical protein
MGSSGGELSAATAAGGSAINPINLAKPDGGQTIVDSTPVLIILHSSHEKTPAMAGAS